MSTKKQRLGKNSPIAEYMAVNHNLDWIEPPEGVDLRNDEDRLTWAQWSMSRLASDWTLSDLGQLGKVVKMEVDIRAMWKQLDEEGIMLFDEDKGRKYENPILASLDKIQKAQLSIIRSMGLNTPSTDPRTMAKAVENVRNHQATVEKNRGSLLAQPHH